MHWDYEFAHPVETDDGEVILKIRFNYLPGRKATHLDPPEPALIEDLDITPEGHIDMDNRDEVAKIEELCFEHVAASAD